jgi:CzcA family heavy metal efflux pump
MTRWIIGTGLQFHYMIVGIAAGLLFLGVTQLQKAPVDLYPEFSPPYVEIQTEALGLSANEVEELVTVPLEADLLNGVAWLETIRSESMPGLSSIVITFEPGTDIMRARQMVQERLTQAHALPNVSKPPVMLQPMSSTSRIMNIGLSSDELSLIEMSVLARWTIKPRLMGVPGVANVAIWGQRKRQLQVQIDPDKLREAGVTLNEVIKTTGESLWVSPLSFLNASVPGTGGFIDTANQRLGIRHVLPIVSAEDLARVPIHGQDMILGDVATLVEDHQPLIGDAIIGDDSGLMLVVEKFPWANTLEVTRGLDAALDALRPGLSGIEIDADIFRPANFIALSMNNLGTALLIGAVLTALFLGFLLYNWRVALISIIAIPLSLSAAGLVLYYSGVSFNTMVLAGLVLALAVIIDDAVIWVDNIMKRLREHREAMDEKKTAYIMFEGTHEVFSAVVFSTLILVLAVAPIFFLEGLSGALFGPLAMAYLVAVLVSLVVSLAVTPAMSRLFIANDNGNGTDKSLVSRRESPAIRWVHQGYSGMLAWLLRTPVLTYLAIGIILLAGLLVVPGLRMESPYPLLQETDLLIRWEGVPGMSHPAMKRISAQATRELRSLPGVRDVGVHVGRAVMSDQVTNVNSAELWISIDPNADYDTMVAAIEEVVDGYAGLDSEILTYPHQRMLEALKGSDDDIVVNIYGQDLEVLRSKAEEVRQAIAPIAGVVDPEVKVQIQEPIVEIEVDLDAAERYGIKPGDVRRAAATLLSGIVVGSLFEEKKVFDVVVWSTPETRRSLSSIHELLIDTPDGDHIHLGDVADIHIAPHPNVINREAVQRYVSVGADISGRDIESVSQDIRQRLKDIEFPLEYHAEIPRQYLVNETATKRVLGYIVIAVIGIYLLLQAAFGSWRLAAAVILSLPTALVGGVLAAFAGGGLLSLGSLAGFFAVFGIAVRNGIMLISNYRQLEQDKGETFGPELVLRGAMERLSPILTSALVTGAAFLPLVLFGGIAGLEIVHPMAVVILGGLVTTTLFCLFVLPALYTHFGYSTEPDMYRRKINAME